MEELITKIQENIVIVIIGVIASILTVSGAVYKGYQYYKAYTKKKDSKKIEEEDRSVKTNLYREHSGFMIERNEVVNEITTLLNPKEGSIENHLVTIVGPQGVGKTSIAKEVGLSLQDNSKKFDGIFFVDLKEVANEDELFYSILDVLNLEQIAKSDILDTLSNWIEHNSNILFILDNFEHLMYLSERVIQVLLFQKNITLLITSQKALKSKLEVEYHLKPIAVPDEKATQVLTEKEIAEIESVQLFLRRAERMPTRLKITEGNKDIISDICRGTGGIPLVIELIAGQMKKLNLSIEEVFTQYEDFFGKSVEPFIRRSYELLSDEEKSVFNQISVFESGFFIEAFENVISSEHNDEKNILSDLLYNLVATEKIKLSEEKIKTRYYMLPSINDFAKKNLKDSYHKKHQLYTKWAYYYVEYLSELSGKIDNDYKIEYIELAALEMDNILSIQDHFFENNPGLSASAILSFAKIMSIRGPHKLRIERLNKAIEALNGLNRYDLEVRLLSQLSSANWTVGKWKDALKIATESVEISVNLVDNKKIVSEAYIQKGLMLKDNGYYEEAIKTLNKAKTILESIKEDGNLGSSIVYTNLGIICERQGNIEKALNYFEQGENYLTGNSNKAVLARLKNTMGLALWHHGWPEKALQNLIESEKLNSEIGYMFFVAGNLTNQGLALIDVGNTELALERFRKAEKIHKETGNPIWMAVNYGGMGRALMINDNEKSLQESLGYLEKSREMLLGRGDKETLGMTLGDLSEVYSKIGNKRGALESIKQAVKVEREVGTINIPRHFIHMVQLIKVKLTDQIGVDNELRNDIEILLSIAENLDLERLSLIERIKPKVEFYENTIKKLVK